MYYYLYLSSIQRFLWQKFSCQIFASVLSFHCFVLRHHSPEWCYSLSNPQRIFVEPIGEGTLTAHSEHALTYLFKEPAGPFLSSGFGQRRNIQRQLAAIHTLRFGSFRPGSVLFYLNLRERTEELRIEPHRSRTKFGLGVCLLKTPSLRLRLGSAILSRCS